MADAVSLSMGGRVASIHRQNTKRRRYMAVVNEIEGKRLGFIKKQLENDKIIEHNKLERHTERVTNANDEMKAFQVALLRRIGVVKEESKQAAGTRPLVNLGRYGGANVEYIKAESEKYKRIRDPKTRRLIKAKIFLEQSKKDGRIKDFDTKKLGNMAEEILKLYKAEIPGPSVIQGINPDIGDLNDVMEADEIETIRSSSTLSEANKEMKIDPRRATYPPAQPRRLVLPPLQVKRTLYPNSNYYRKISADYHKREDARRNRQQASPVHRRLSLLEDITEEGNEKEKRKHKTNHKMTNGNSFPSKFPVTSLSNYKPRGSEEPRRRHVTSYYEWENSKPIGPLKLEKHFNENQKFWKPQDSVPSKQGRNVVLPKLS